MTTLAPDTPHFVNPPTSRVRAAYQQILSEIKGVSDSEWLGVNADMHQASITVLQALPALQGLRRDIVTQLPGFDSERFDRLETIALAVLHVDSLYRAAITPRAELAESSPVVPDCTEQSPLVISEIIQNRHRVFTLLVRAYERVRWAVARLRPEDADWLAPALDPRLDGAADNAVAAGGAGAPPPAPTPAPITVVSGAPVAAARPETFR
jgi:hypothetical protein